MVLVFLPGVCPVFMLGDYMDIFISLYIHKIQQRLI